MSEDIDERYMRRCLQLAVCGRQNAKPNPMVGAVIVVDGRIIGEGYHIRCGERHAEVNAFDSVKQDDAPLLRASTLYVSLEPCSHFGKTPPCADLIISKGVRRVVIGCVDPFSKVKGHGIQKLTNAGLDVKVGVLEEECRFVNRCFITFHEHHRPYITLKWAQSANGFLDCNFKPFTFSTPFTQMLSHKLRAESDAILVGRVTAQRDSPQLNVRHWYGRNPLRLVLDRNNPCFPSLDFSRPILPQLMQELYLRNIQSLIVEGGAKTHEEFIASDLWDELRIETCPTVIANGTKAPSLPTNTVLFSREQFDDNTIDVYTRDGGNGQQL